MTVDETGKKLKFGNTEEGEEVEIRTHKNKDKKLKIEHKKKEQKKFSERTSAGVSTMLGSYSTCAGARVKFTVRDSGTR